MNSITVRPATTEADIDDVVQLCWAYRDLLTNLPGISDAVLSAFQPASTYQALMDRLPVIHARPKGIMMLAYDAYGAPVGCGMSHPLAPDVSEVKRVFVTQEARGEGVAAQLCEALVDQARADGFERTVLDTHRDLLSAQRLYLRLGFTPRGPYQEMPPEVLPELLFFEKELQ